ncbi:hypothetical protein OIU34_27160 [Pararhizobium sp. BT-229]|uniref:hypothetical protein n=1 Tax=Pararhizobium sp. BT-229 TaxID=2986923 RepID=UPI0021F75E0C|nr:hypothetical protein [Pararhizobium sp. BT-229]MCV9965560.1 hypothetical protein [Pararhizobium sp. BT-229]
MRRFAIAAALAAVPVVSFAATSHADSASRQRHNDYYYKSYDTAYRPICVTRKIHTTGEEGNAAVKTVRICR